MTQLVKFFNSSCCTIVLGRILIFFAVFSQSLNIKMGWDLQGCYSKDCFAHLFLQLYQLVILLFLIKISIISLLQCISKIHLQLFCMDFKCLALDGNIYYYVIFDLFSDIISFGFCFYVNMGLILSEKLFTWVSNMKIPRFNLIIYNFCNW